MTGEFVGIVIVGTSQLAGLAILGLYLRSDFREQLRRNLALETQFQKWNAEQFGNVGQRLDQILEMLRSRQL